MRRVARMLVYLQVVRPCQLITTVRPIRMLAAMWSRRVRLRPLMLVAILFSIVVCVAGIRHQLTSSPEPDRRLWSNFNSPEFSKGDNWGLYRSDLAGKIDVVVLPNLSGLQAFQKMNAEQNVEMLAISNDDVFRAIDLTGFANVRRLALTELTLSVGWTDRLRKLPSLEYVCITQFTIDPTPLVRELTQLSHLKHLVIRTNQMRSVDDFPTLGQLETLLIKTAELDEADLRKLQDRMPGCSVSIHRGHYHRGLHDLDSLSIEP